MFIAILKGVRGESPV